jgi:uncharacterized membrane protein
MNINNCAVNGCLAMVGMSIAVFNNCSGEVATMYVCTGFICFSLADIVREIRRWRNKE